MAAYYDYTRDYPGGDKWYHSTYESQFDGEVISSPDYVFPRGKYAGKTLQNIVSRCWKGVIKYIDHGLIFITKECREKLVCDVKKIRAINIACDSKLMYCEIGWVFDELYSKPFACFHQGERFIDVAQDDPRYLIGLISRATYPRYGENQRFYATDECHTLLYHDNNWLEKISNHLQKEGVNNVFTTYLINLDRSLKEEEEAQRKYEEEQADAEYEEWKIEEAYNEYVDMMNEFEAWDDF